MIVSSIPVRLGTSSIIWLDVCCSNMASLDFDCAGFEFEMCFHIGFELETVVNISECGAEEWAKGRKSRGETFTLYITCRTHVSIICCFDFSSNLLCTIF